MTAALAAMGGKWNLIVLYWLGTGTRRFNELRKLMPSISHKVLTQTLRDLVANGLVTRESTGTAPSRVEYSLSTHGESLAPVVEAVRLWGHVHLRWSKGRGPT
jgi:DNA-binding HxlR family transcriptional regulator